MRWFCLGDSKYGFAGTTRQHYICFTTSRSKSCLEIQAKLPAVGKAKRCRSEDKLPVPELYMRASGCKNARVLSRFVEAHWDYQEVPSVHERAGVERLPAGGEVVSAAEIQE